MLLIKMFSFALRMMLFLSSLNMILKPVFFIFQNAVLDTSFNGKFNHTIDIMSLRVTISLIADLLDQNVYAKRGKNRHITPVKAYIQMNFTNHKRHKAVGSVSYEEILLLCIDSDKMFGFNLMNLFLENCETKTSIYDFESVFSLYGTIFANFNEQKIINILIKVRLKSKSVKSGFF